MVSNSVWRRAAGLAARQSQSRVLRAAGVLGACVLLALAGAGSWLGYRQAEEAAEQRTKTVASMLAAHTESSIDGIDLVLQATVHDVEEMLAAGPPRWLQIHYNITDYLRAVPQVDQLLVLDANGDTIVDSAAVVPRSLNVADRRYFRAHWERADRGLFVDTPILGRLSGKWLISLSRGFNKPDGSFGGVVVSTVDVAGLSDIFQARSLGKDDTITLLDDSGVVFARHPFDHSAIGTKLSSPLLRHAQTTGPQPFITSRAWLAKQPLIVQVETTAAASLRGWWTSLYVMMPTTAGMAFVIVFAFVQLARRAAERERIGVELEARQREIEAARRKAEELREIAVAERARAVAAERAKSQFLTNMHIELTEPLHAIVGLAAGLPSYGRLDRLQVAQVSQIHESGQMLQALVHMLLETGAIESGRVVLRHDDVDLHAVLQGCYNLLKGRAMRSGIAFALDLDKRTPVVRGDALRLRQIVLNLAFNALRFTNEGGRVVLRTTADAGGGCTIAVEDTGVGMLREEIAAALEPFRGVSGAIGRRNEGTGLGLPIAKALVEAHDAQLVIDSTPGEGTVVQVRFPKRRVISLDPPPVAAAAE